MLDKSAKIALTILRTIREKGISQKQLAEMLNTSPQHVNKLLKGNENFTLETISRIEIALGTKLIEILDGHVSMKVEQNKSAVKVA
ncbi:MAG: helix-turn-helix transcriptional regulator [bacterium]